MRTSRLWLLGPPFALLISALVYYVKFPGFRNWTDRNIPWVKENVAPRLPTLRHSIEEQVRNHPEVKSLVTDLVSTVSDPVPAIGAPAEPAKKSYVLKDGSVDLQELAATPANWPKMLNLKKPTQFPAVRDGQVIGTLTAPAGSEVRLMKIHQGKIGVEFQGGGGWILPEDSNLGEKLQ